MNFIEIKEGMSISVDKIEAVESISQLRCKIHVTGGTGYEVNMPYRSLLKMLGSDNKLMKKLDGVLSTAGFFAG